MSYNLISGPGRLTNHMIESSFHQTIDASNRDGKTAFNRERSRVKPDS